jgi:hypothetical protein
MRTGKIKPSEILQAPYISVKAKVIQPGTTNGHPNIKYKDEYVIAPSGKKIATYIRNQLFGSELITKTEGLDINWLMPTLSEALEKAIYQTESFIYLHKYNNKVYLECLNKNDIHDLVQVFDQVKEATIIQEFENDEDKFELHRHIIITGDGTSIVEFKAFISENNKLRQISLEKFNSIFNTEYEQIENKPYEVLVNIDTGQDFFKDSKKLLNEEMNLINTMAEEIDKTKTRIATTQHYQSGDIATNWQPSSTNYQVSTINVGKLQDYFVLMPGDRDHQFFNFLQGDIRVDDYEKTFKFYDYQIIQMAGLSPASFGYEKDNYMNVANVDLSANASEMTIEAIKRQLEPQINRLIENIIRLQQSQDITENAIPSEIKWEYGANERIDDMKKLEIVKEVQRTMSVPYSVRADIVLPVLNRLVDEPIEKEDLIKEWQEENNKMNIEFGEL